VSNRKLSRKTNKGNKGSGLYRPGLLVIAAALFWAGLHAQGTLTPVTLLLWGLSAVTAGVLMRAALAVVEPLVKLAFDAARRALHETGAEEP
jgi:hypothetical protein